MESPDPFENIPDLLKCPVCMDIPKGKVFQCPSGHTVCDECHFQISTCPQCRVPLVGEPIRNLIVEKMLNDLKLKLECPYKVFGCREKVERNLVQKHMEKCRFGGNTFGRGTAAALSSNLDTETITALTSINFVEAVRAPAPPCILSPPSINLDRVATVLMPFSFSPSINLVEAARAPAPRSINVFARAETVPGPSYFPSTNLAEAAGAPAQASCSSQSSVNLAKAARVLAPSFSPSISSAKAARAPVVVPATTSSSSTSSPIHVATETSRRSRSRSTSIKEVRMRRNYKYAPLYEEKGTCSIS